MFRRRPLRSRLHRKRRAGPRRPRFRRRVVGRRSFKGRRGGGGGLRGNYATITENFEQNLPLNTGVLQTFSLNTNDWPRAAAATGQYKYYRLKHLAVTYFAPFNDYTANATLTNPQTPTFYWLRAKEAPAQSLDPLQGTTGVLLNLQQVGAVKSVWTRKKVISYKPNLQSPMMVSALPSLVGAGTSLAPTDPQGASATTSVVLPTAVWNKWLPTQDPLNTSNDVFDIPRIWYYGHYVYIDAPAAGLSPPTPVRAVVRATWEFKEPQIPNIIAPPSP